MSDMGGNHGRVKIVISGNYIVLYVRCSLTDT